MEKFIKENFDLKTVKKRAEIQTIDCCSYVLELLTKNNITYQFFGSLIDVDPVKLSRILTGKSSLSVKMYFRLQNGVQQIFKLMDEFQKSKENESKNPV